MESRLPESPSCSSEISETPESIEGVVALSRRPRVARRQGRYWAITCKKEGEYHPIQSFESSNGLVRYGKGQGERGHETGYEHWQFFVILTRKASLRALKDFFPEHAHLELSRSSAYEQYVWKEDTRIPDSQFQWGVKTFNRGDPHDWDVVWENAKSGDIMSVPSSIRIQHYRTLRSIFVDFAKPSGLERTCEVYWGKTNTGKSRRAWELAGVDAYPKDPRSKWWCGYNGNANVVIDEFRGAIDISHLLRWLDRYPVSVETKGGAMPMKSTKFFITSNIPPQRWYTDVDEETLNALLRRFTRVIHFDSL